MTRQKRKVKNFTDKLNNWNANLRRLLHIVCSVSVRYDFPQFVPVIRKQLYYRENSVTIRAALALLVYQPPKYSKLINSAIDKHTEK